MTPLEIIQQATIELGLVVPNAISGSTDATVRQLMGLLNRECRQLAARHEWQSLTREGLFVTVATESQGALTTIIGSDRLRHIIGDTLWNRTQRRPVLGPKSSRQWQGGKALITAGPFPEFRIRGGELLMNPAPAAGESVYFEYVSDYWCETSDGTAKEMVTADDDVINLDTSLALDGLVWRWRKAKGQDYTEEFNEYERRVAVATANDVPKGVKSLDGREAELRPGIGIPEGSWAVT